VSEEKTADAPKPEGPLVPGLTDPRALSLERTPIRTRESSVTRSAWRLTVASVEGGGSIALVEAGEETRYRGDGVFLGWPQERLEAAYRALLPESDEGTIQLQQFG
jgi:hypothetical protein